LTDYREVEIVSVSSVRRNSLSFRTPDDGGMRHSIEMLMPLITDLRHGLRVLRKAPAFTLVAVSSLALGIGVNVTIYSVAREMILDDLSAHQPDRLVRFGSVISTGNYRDLGHAGVFQGLAFDTGLGNSDWEAGGHSEIAWEMTTSANFFDVLGVGSSLGRLYSQSDQGLPVAVVSNGFWRKRMHSDPGAVGHPIQLGGRLYTVLGVLPRDYRSIMRHGVSPEVYLLADKDPGRCQPFGRLRDGFTRDQSRQALLAAARNIGGEDFAKQISSLRPMAGWAANAATLGDDRRFFMFFAMLYGTAIVLVVIGCFNVAGLVLARGVTRQREIAIRKALGANRFQVARQLLAEGLVLVSSGTGAGLIIDAFLRNWLSYLRWPSAYNLPFEFHFQSDRGLFLYASATALAALLISSMLPSLRSSNADLGLAMKQSEPAFSVRRWNLRNGFVTLQVLLSMVLLTLGVLLCRTFWRLANVNPGFDISHTVLATVWRPRGPRLPDQKGWSWRDGVVRRLEEVPGVIGVTSIGTLPLMGELPQNPIRRKGDALSAARDAYTMGAGEQFCKVLGIPVLRGRDFDISDRTRQPVPALVSQALARRLFGDTDPVGAEVLVGRERERVLEIVGVIGDTKMRTLGEDHAPMFLTPYEDTQMMIRTAGDAAHWIKPIRDMLTREETGSALDVRPSSEAAAGAIFPMRVAAGFVGSMSGVGLLLALSGLYSSVSYATQRRTREMAIRVAVGATRSGILWTAIRDGVAVLGCGITLGLPIAMAAIQPLTAILPDGLNPWNPLMFAAVVLVLLATGAAAAWIPARKASNADPSFVLRQD
jgi:putative ABC transport system permease protein